jgi:Major Facilitator Superfamily.
MISKVNHKLVGSKYNWLYSIMLYNIAASPVSTIVVLYIIEVGGSVIDASNAITTSTLVSIVASYIWGRISDVYKSRRNLLLISISSLSLLTVSLYFERKILEIILTYALFSFLNSANSAAINLLIMETNHESKWKNAFSRYLFLSSVGNTVGLAFSFGITGLLSIQDLIFSLFIISIISLIFAYYSIPETMTKQERKIFISNLHAFISRIFTHPFMILRKINGNHNMNISNLSKNLIYRIYAVIFVFYFGSGMFNTVFPAGLKVYTLSNFLVFLVLFFGMFIQTVSYYYLGKRITSSIREIYLALIVRGISYSLIGLTFLFPVIPIVYSSLLFYPIAAGIGFSMFYINSNILIFHAIGNNERGKLLGLYTAMISFGNLLGAWVSGYLAYYVGYWFVFILAGIVILLCEILFSIIKIEKII